MNTILNQFGLSQRDMEEILGILKSQTEVKIVHLFGSRAKGTFHSGSDVDLAIMNVGVSESTKRKLVEQFRESALPYEVDLVDYTQLAHIPFKEHIERVGKKLFERI